jgi:IPT/TIG domain
VVVLACAVYVLAAAGAGAATVTVGSPLTAPYFSTITCGAAPGCMYANTALSEPGAHVTSPVSGRIVRWRIAGNYSGDFVLRVLRPTGTGQYTGAGSTLPVNATGETTVSFPADLAIEAGDLIGVDYEDGRHLATATATGSAFSYWSPALAELGSAPPSSTSANLEVLFNADVQPRPQIASLAPARGPTSGGTAVVLTGSDFDEASAVSFGTAPAASFSVDSPSQITAVSPPAAAGTVDVAVSTAGGTSTPSGADRFTYASPRKCVVPRLRLKRLSAARRALKRAGCRLGSVRGRRSKRAVVKRQHPRPGTVLAAGGRVSVKLGPRPRRR